MRPNVIPTKALKKQIIIMHAIFVLMFFVSCSSAENVDPAVECHQYIVNQLQTNYSTLNEDLFNYSKIAKSKLYNYTQITLNQWALNHSTSLVDLLVHNTNGIAD